MGSEVQGVSESRAHLMEVSSDREGRVPRAGFPYQRDELFLHSTPCNLYSFLSAAQTRMTSTFTPAPSLPFQVGHPVLPPAGLHPCVHHGAGPGGKAGSRVQQAQREDDCPLHRQRPGPPLLVQGTGCGECRGGSLSCCLAPKATGEAHTRRVELRMSHPKAWGC